MHMRKKKWARPELAACPFYIPDPAAYRGKWRTLFPADQPLYLELGCGKGVSTALMVHDNPGVNYIAMDISPDVLGDARRNIMRAYGDDPVSNILLTRGDIEYIRTFLSPEDNIERIYIHFCNPWAERPKHVKRRLTHPRQLMQYRHFFKDGGEIWFKTDDDDLFRDSLDYFPACGFEAVHISYNLHAEGFQPNYVSEHEQKYTALGVPIKLAIFRKLQEAPDIDPVRWMRPAKTIRDVEKPVSQPELPLQSGTGYDTIKAENPVLQNSTKTEENPMKIYSVTDPEFAPYGRVVTGYPTEGILAALAETPLPDGVEYVGKVAALEAAKDAREVGTGLFGGMPFQLGYCNGHNTKLNCLEYHRDSEFNLGTEDFILLLAKQDDIVDGKLDTAKVKAFRAAAGVLIEVYATSLHYAPCHADPAKGFRVLVALPDGTNTDYRPEGGANTLDATLWARNKWLLAHAEASEATDGAYVGLEGVNIDIATDL